MAMSLDGKVARPDGKWYGLSSKEDRIQMDIYRSEVEVLILGKNSIQNDDPNVHIRYLKNCKSPRPVLLIRKGILSKEKKIFQFAEEKPLIFCLSGNEKELKEELSSLADIICIKGNELSPTKVIEALSKLGYKKILLEGGPKLNYAFFKENLVTQINITLIPYLIGQNSLPSIVDGNMAFLDFDKNSWTLKTVRHVGDEIFLSYRKK